MTNIVDSYGWESEQAPDSCNFLTPEVLRILKTLKVTRVCDLGSGNGALANTMNQAGYYVSGIDYDTQGVELSKDKYQDINFYNLGVQDDPAPLINAEGQLFDTVVSTEVVEHLFSPHQLPIFARQLLPENGYLVISTPYHGYLKNLALSIFNKWDFHHTALWHGGHIKFWSRKTLTQLLQENGFEVIGFHGVGRVPYLWKCMILVARAI